MAAKTVQIDSFCGGTSKLLDSSFMGFEESVNMYPETVESTDTFSRKILKSIEGMSEFVDTELYNIKKIFLASVSPDGASGGGPVIFAITDNFLLRVYDDGAVEQCGRFCENNSDTRNYIVGENISVCETSGSSPYIVICAKFAHQDGTNAKNLIYCFPTTYYGASKRLYPLALPDAFDHSGKINPTAVCYLNYRLVVNDNGHDYIYWSELNKPDGVDDDKAFYQKLTRYTYTKTDGTEVTADDNQYYAPAYGTYQAGTLNTEEVWMAALNNVKVDFKADNVKNVVSIDSSIIAFGSTSYQIYKWQDSQYCPFVTSSKASSVGLRAGSTCAVMDNKVYFLGDGAMGANAIFRLGEGGVERISTKSIEQRISRVVDKDDSFAFAYSYKGHSFYVITFKGSDDNFTLCYDISENVWHTRASMDEKGGMNCWNVNSSVVAYGSVIFSVYNGQKLFRFDKDSYVDVDGHAIPRIRTTGIKFDGVNDIIAHKLELVTDNGLVRDFELNPRVMLQVSHDGGFTWSNEKWAKSGMMGHYDYRTIFEGLGTGSRLAFRVKMTDPAPFNIATAFLTVTPCKNRIF